MSQRNLNDAALQPLAPGEYALVMAKSQENRLAFATWLLFFRDQGRFPRDASDLELVDIPALTRQLEVTAPTEGTFPVAEEPPNVCAAKSVRATAFGKPPSLMRRS
jgi:hypothetical protein